MTKIWTFVREIRKDHTVKLPSPERRALNFSPGTLVKVTLEKIKVEDPKVGNA